MSDPFEKGRAQGEKSAQEQIEQRQDYDQRKKAVSSRFKSLLTPKFAPHNFHLRIDDFSGELRISIYPMDEDSRAEFAIAASYSGKGIYVRDQFDAGSDIFEHNCSEDRALELAGQYFGRALKYMNQGRQK